MAKKVNQKQRIITYFEVFLLHLSCQKHTLSLKFEVNSNKNLFTKSIKYCNFNSFYFFIALKNINKKVSFQCQENYLMLHKNHHKKNIINL